MLNVPYTVVMMHSGSSSMHMLLFIDIPVNKALTAESCYKWSLDLIQTFLVKHGIPVVCQPCYSPDKALKCF